MKKIFFPFAYYSLKQIKEKKVEQDCASTHKTANNKSDPNPTIFSQYHLILFDIYICM